jgi:hypothetical protein
MTAIVHICNDEHFQAVDGCMKGFLSFVRARSYLCIA